jgi:hypothetical protein
LAAPTIGVRPRPNAQKAGDQGQRSAGTNLRGACDAPRTPEFSFHGGANIFHFHRLERTGAQMRRGNHDMIDPPAFAEQIRDALVAGDVGRNRGRVQFFRGSVQTLYTARGNDDLGAFTFRQFGSRKPDAGRSAHDDDFLICEQHVCPLMRLMRSGRLKASADAGLALT